MLGSTTLSAKILIAARRLLGFGQVRKIRSDSLMLDLLDWMAETTKYRSRIADIFSIFLNVDKVYDFLLLPTVLIIPPVIYPSPSTPSTTYPSSPAAADEQKENN